MTVTDFAVIASSAIAVAAFVRSFYTARRARELAKINTMDLESRVRAIGVFELQNALNLVTTELSIVFHDLHDTVALLLVQDAFVRYLDPIQQAQWQTLFHKIEADKQRIESPLLRDPKLFGTAGGFSK